MLFTGPGESEGAGVGSHLGDVPQRRGSGTQLSCPLHNFTCHKEMQDSNGSRLLKPGALGMPAVTGARALRRDRAFPWHTPVAQPPRSHGQV